MLEINIEELITSKVLESLYSQYKSYISDDLKKEIYELICFPDRIEKNNINKDINSIKYYVKYEYDKKGD